jgi:hypothetical protein
MDLGNKNRRKYTMNTWINGINWQEIEIVAAPEVDEELHLWANNGGC